MELEERLSSSMMVTGAFFERFAGGGECGGEGGGGGEVGGDDGGSGGEDGEGGSLFESLSWIGLSNWRRRAFASFAFFARNSFIACSRVIHLDSRHSNKC